MSKAVPTRMRLAVAGTLAALALLVSSGAPDDATAATPPGKLRAAERLITLLPGAPPSARQGLLNALSALAKSNEGEL